MTDRQMNSLAQWLSVMTRLKTDGTQSIGTPISFITFSNFQFSFLKWIQSRKSRFTYLLIEVQHDA